MTDILAVPATAKVADNNRKASQLSAQDTTQGDEKQQSFDAEYASDGRELPSGDATGSQAELITELPDTVLSDALEEPAIETAEDSIPEPDLDVVSPLQLPPRSSVLTSTKRSVVSSEEKTEETQPVNNRADSLEGLSASVIEDGKKKQPGRELPETNSIPVRAEQSIVTRDNLASGATRKPAPSAAETVFVSRSNESAQVAGKPEHTIAELSVEKTRPPVPGTTSDVPRTAEPKNPIIPNDMPVKRFSVEVPERVGSDRFEELGKARIQPKSNAQTLQMPSQVVIQNPTEITKAVAGNGRDKFEIGTMSQLEAEASGIWEPKSAKSGSSASLVQSVSKPELPATIARQLAEALQRLPDRPVELSLSPRELGRVRMSIAAGETGITVNVLSERPETTELMRRNIEELAKEFEAIGYENISFAFADSNPQSEPGEQMQTDEGENAVELHFDDEIPQSKAHHQVSSGLDLRL